MKRQTRTELDKIVMIGLGRIDQIIEKCCDDLEKLKPTPAGTITNIAFWPRKLSDAEMLVFMDGRHSNAITIKQCRFFNNGGTCFSFNT